MKIVFKCKEMIPFARASEHRMRLRYLSESDNAGFVTGHGENLSASHIAYLEQTHDFVRHFRRAVSDGLRSCRSAIEKRRPQNRVVTMNHRRGR